MKRKPKAKPVIDPALLSVKKVPAQIITAEKVAEKLTGKKKKDKYKTSTKYRAAIKNYRNAVTRYRRSLTLLQNRDKTLRWFVKKYQ